MGEHYRLHHASFNHALQIESRTDRLSSDGGAILLREGLDRCGIIEYLDQRLVDPRDPNRVRHSLPELLRTSLSMMAQGWGDQGDAARLSTDPLMATCGSDERGQRAAAYPPASQATFSRLLDILSREENLQVLEDASIEMAGRRVRSERRGARRATMTIDIDGVPLRAHGHQGGSAYSGYTGQRQHYPLFASCAETGDHFGALLRAGNAGPAQEAASWIPRVVERVRPFARQVRVRMDAGFTDGVTLNTLDEHGIDFIGRLPSNPALERLFEPHRYRGPGRPPQESEEWIVETTHQAETWASRQRILMVIRYEPEEMLRRCFFLVTNIPKERASAAFLRDHYRKRGKAEGHFGEHKNAVGESLPCTARSAATTEASVLARSQALLSLRVIAYELMHLLRAQMERISGEGWSLLRLRERILKVACRVTYHARRVRVDIERRAMSHWNALRSRIRAMEPQPG